MLQNQQKSGRERILYQDVMLHQYEHELELEGD